MAKKQPGVYDHVLPGLPVAPPEDVKYQEKVDALKIDIGRPDAMTLANLYTEARAEKDALEAEEYKVNMRIEAITQLLADSEERGDAGWGDYGANDNALKLIDGGNIRVQPEPYAQVSNKEDFRLWCIANGYERKLQLWPSTTNAVCKERLKNGEPMPDGCEMYKRNKVVYTPGEKK